MLLWYDLIWISPDLQYLYIQYLTLLLPADLMLCAPEPQVLQNKRLHHQSGPQIPLVDSYTECTHLEGLKHTTSDIKGQ